MSYIKTKRGLNWCYDIKGEGKCLLFLHGWGANKRIWKQQIDFFSKFYQVVNVDLPGHGKTSWQKMTLEDIVDEVDFIISELGLREISLIASSLGGLIALKFIDTFPDRIKRFVSVSALPKFARSEDYPFGLWAPRIYKLSVQLETEYPIILNIFFRSLFTIQERERCKIGWLQQFKQEDDIPKREALQEYLKILENEDLREEFYRITIPVLLMHGTEDYICSKEAVNFLNRKLPQSQVHFFEQCGHFPFLTKPQEFNQVLEEFLKT